MSDQVLKALNKQVVKEPKVVAKTISAKPFEALRRKASGPFKAVKSVDER